MYRQPHNISDTPDNGLFVITNEDTLTLISEQQSIELCTETGIVRKRITRTPIELTRSELYKAVDMLQADDEEEILKHMQEVN